MFGLFKSKAEKLQDEGIRLAEKGHFEQAIKCLEQALEIEPENGAFRYNLGLVYVRNSDVYKALQEFKVALRYQRDYADTYFAIATSIYPEGPDWKAAIYYLAYLDFTTSGEKAHSAQVRLTELGSKALGFDVEQWLESAKKSYEYFVNDMGNMGMRLASTLSHLKPGEGTAISTGLHSWLSDVAPQKAKQWAGPHFENGLELFNQGKFRAAIAQIITGLDIYPHDQFGMCLLAGTYAFGGDFEQANKIVEFVDIQKAEPGAREFISGKVQEIKTFIHSRRPDLK